MANILNGKQQMAALPNMGDLGKSLGELYQGLRSAGVPEGEARTLTNDFLKQIMAAAPKVG